MSGGKGHGSSLRSGKSCPSPSCPSSVSSGHLRRILCGNRTFQSILSISSLQLITNASIVFFFLKLQAALVYCLPIFTVFCCLRYAYSEEAGEEFDKDEMSLTHIKPYSTSPDDNEARALKGSDVESDDEVEEDKTE